MWNIVNHWFKKKRKIKYIFIFFPFKVKLFSLWNTQNRKTDEASWIATVTYVHVGESLGTS